MWAYYQNQINETKYSSQIVLQSKEFDDYYKSHEERETFCEAFFMASIPYKNGQASDISNSLKASCGHDICSSQPAIKPEIILRYPLKDTKTLELSNLAASLCFPTGIKLCYSQKGPEKMMGDYGTLITNQNGERFYMMTFHFYLEMSTDDFKKK